jgi:hypothetical protein
MKSQQISNFTDGDISVFEDKFLHSTLLFVLLVDGCPEHSASSTEAT